MVRLAFSTFAVLLAVGCGKEAARVAFAGSGAGETTAHLAAKEVSFWTDLDVEWEGDGSAVYEIVLRQGDEQVAKTKCDALARPSVRLSWVETNVGKRHTRKGQGKMSCEVSLSRAGKTAIEVRLQVNDVTVHKADLVLKQ